jgi:RNA exonuclease NGL2
MYPTAPFIPTPEQLALREARQLKKQKAAANAGVASSIGARGQIIERPWLTVQPPSKALQSVRVMTWNVRDFPVVCTASGTCNSLPD